MSDIFIFVDLRFFWASELGVGTTFSCVQGVLLEVDQHVVKFLINIVPFVSSFSWIIPSVSILQLILNSSLNVIEFIIFVSLEHLLDGVSISDIPVGRFLHLSNSLVFEFACEVLFYLVFKNEYLLFF